MPFAHAPDLRIASDDAGPSDGTAALLLHGRPDDPQREAPDALDARRLPFLLGERP